jgi:phosphoribosylformylglycinamidine cyclo-ligase
MAFLQAQGNIEPGEMARTFNCGIGMAVFISQDDVKHASQALEEAGETLFDIGRVEARERGCTVSGPRGTWSARDDWFATHHG